MTVSLARAEKIISTRKGSPWSFTWKTNTSSTTHAVSEHLSPVLPLLATNQAYVGPDSSRAVLDVTLTVRELQLLACPDMNGKFESIE